MKNKKTSTANASDTKKRAAPTISSILDDGTIVELVHEPLNHQTSFACYAHGKWTSQTQVTEPHSEDLIPYSASNTLIKNKVVLFPSKPEDYGTQEELVAEIQTFIHRYVDVSEAFERIATYYVLFSWVYDAFNELPYLRVRGDYGSGKTRFLLVVGSITYKPIFGSGASTVSPIFHLLDRFGGTLVIDEADFRFSDEKADIIKILNNGNVRGFPVLRSEVNKAGEYNPRAFHVYGPKIIATRRDYQDKALESRFITEDMGQRKLRSDIPINLPPTYQDEARALRNKLLMYRFHNRMRLKANAELVDHSLEPRLNQVFVPLLSIIDDEGVCEELKGIAREHHEKRIAERGHSIEAQLLTVIRHLLSHSTGIGVSVGDITRQFVVAYGSDYERKITHKWIGTLIRTKLHLKTQKSNGRFVVPVTEKEKLDRLYERYGVGEEDLIHFEEAASEDLTWEPVETGDLGTSGTLSDAQGASGASQ